MCPNYVMWVSQICRIEPHPLSDATIIYAWSLLKIETQQELLAGWNSQLHTHALTCVEQLSQTLSFPRDYTIKEVCI